jgi:pimeloyl-ACP methyl ester carboxylesterase
VQIAKELKTLLKTAGEEGPYVLVGHSFGGFNVRVFTELYPTDVLGVVLADGAHEDEEKRINEMLPGAVVEQEERNDLWNMRVNKFLTPLRIRLGIQRLQVATGWGIRVTDFFSLRGTFRRNSGRSFYTFDNKGSSKTPWRLRSRPSQKVLLRFARREIWENAHSLC